jgi:protein-S-isoprenylcysteine O-methyltransferase Ste14
LPELPSLGRRGGGWVALQFVLMAVIVAVCVFGQRWPDPVQIPLAVLGVGLQLAGGALVVWSSRLLGRNLRPFPRPPRDGALVEDGPYRVVRHPIYSGAVLFFAGLSLALSPLALVPTAVLAVVLALKSAVEERFLQEAFPTYRPYADRTRWRLVPLIY